MQVGMSAIEDNSRREPKTKGKLATIKLDRDIYDKVEEYIEKGHRGVGGIRKFVNDCVSDRVDWLDVNARMEEPFMKFVTIQDNSIYVNDYKLDPPQMKEVKMRYIDAKGDKLELFCVSENSKDCIHCAFCLRIPELAKLDVVHERRDKPSSSSTSVKRR